MTERAAVMFVGHGSPMNVIEDNQWSRGFAQLLEGAPRPRAVLAVSAHWFVDGVRVTAEERPKTIHDFGGFPEPLYRIQYPASGDPGLAARVAERTGAEPVRDWGLDHGTWSVLRWMLPKADVPVIQLSIDRRLPAAEHLALGRRLAPLRDEGVLILGSGNVVHNLGDAVQRKRAGETAPPDWAARFDAATRDALRAHDHDALAALHETADGRRAHPTPEHWLPILYAAGASDPDDDVRFPIEGFDWGSLSMRTVVFG